MGERNYLLVLGVISFFCCWLDCINIKNIYKQIIFVFVLLFALYCGCINFPFSTDYYVYKGYYDYAPETIDFEIDNDLADYGFIWLNMIIKYYGGSLNDVYFVICSTIILIYFIMIKKFTPYIFCAWYLLFARFFELQNIVQIRQGLAIVIMLYALKYIYEKNIIKYIIFIIIATLIHKTLIVALVLYPLAKINWNKKKVAIFIILSSILYVIPITNILFNIFLPTIGVEVPKFDFYQGTVYAEETSLLGNISRLIIGTFLVYFLLKVKEKLYCNIFLTMILLGIFVMCAFSDFGILSGRLANIFFIAFSFAPVCLFDLIKNKKNRLLIITIYILITTIFVLKNYVFFVISSGTV